MNFDFAVRAFHAGKLALKANAPTLMVVGGVVSMGTGAVLGAKKTLHLEEIVEPHVTMLEQIEANKELPQYSERQIVQDKTVVITRLTVDVTKLYAVPAILFVGGSALVFGGHRMMLQRNATLAIGFTALQKAFDSYRQRVRQEFGDEVDQALQSGWIKKEVVDEDGKVQTINTRDWDAIEEDPYNRIFGQGESDEWVDDLGMNKMFVHNQQRFANEKLSRRGYLYLCEVYEALGFAETPISRVVGWKVRYNPDGSRDIPFVDLGLDKRQPDDWTYSRENAIYLDINCQGLIVGGNIQKALEKA